MKTKRTKTQEQMPASETENRVERIETAMAAGAVAGAAIGAIAGPPGMLAGGLLGTAAGVAAGEALADDAERRHERARRVDREIGVTGGDLGAADPSQPPARIGAFSSGSAGVGSPTPTPSEGPIQDVDD